ncbi:MAG: hypothetical protein HZA50_04200 [Planctomycetes bacterium]|nr:hypothetical protein [Planctomycetota bacterium]
MPAKITDATTGTVVGHTGKMPVPLIQHAARAWPAGLAILGLYMVFVIARLAWHGWDASVFVCAGANCSDPSAVPKGLTVRPNTDGYDGQFYYAMALDPFSDEKVTHGITFDNPAYRHQRIGYPVLCRLASFDRPELLPWAMIGVNLFWMFVVGWAGGRFAASAGFNWRWGLLAGLWPGFMVSLGRDLTETQETALLLAGLLAWGAGKRGAGAIIFSAAILTRETAVLVPFALGAYQLWLLIRGQKSRKPDDPSAPPASRIRPILWLFIPAGIFVGWQLWLHHIYGYWAPASHSTDADPVCLVPFLDLIRFSIDGFPFRPLSDTLAPSFMSPAAAAGAYWIYSLFFLLAIAALAVLAGIAWRKSKVSPAVKAAWPMLLAIAAVLGKNTWVAGPSGFPRMLLAMATVSCILLIGSSKKLRIAAACLLAASWLAGLPYCILMP